MGDTINYNKELEKVKKDSDPIKFGNIQITLDLFKDFTDIELRSVLCIAALVDLCRSGYYISEKGEDIDPDLVYVKGLKNVGIRLNSIEDLLDSPLQEYYVKNVEPDVTKASKFSDEVIQKVLFLSVFYGYMDLDKMKNEDDSINDDSPVSKLLKREVNGKEMTNEELSLGRYIFISEEEYYSAVSAGLIPKTNRIREFNENNLEFYYAEINNETSNLDISFKYTPENQETLEFDGIKLNDAEKDALNLIDKMKICKISIPLYQIGEYLFDYEYNIDLEEDIKKDKVKRMLSTYLSQYFMGEFFSILEEFGVILEKAEDMSK